jgi:hypothetical protein
MIQWDPTKSLPTIVPHDFSDKTPHALTLHAIGYAQVIRISMFGDRPEIQDLPFLAV